MEFDGVTPIDFFNELARRLSPSPPDTGSYEAVNENPRVFCSTGTSPAEALYNMADELAINNIEYWTASSTHFDDEGNFYLTIYA